MTKRGWIAREVFWGYVYRSTLPEGQGCPPKLQECVDGRGRFGGQTAGGHPKAFSWARQALFAVPALREFESACRVSILCEGVTVPTVCFSGALRGSPGEGQQQFATQTLHVHLLGLEKSQEQLS